MCCAEDHSRYQRFRSRKFGSLRTSEAVASEGRTKSEVIYQGGQGCTGMRGGDEDHTTHSLDKIPNLQNVAVPRYPQSEEVV